MTVFVYCLSTLGAGLLVLSIVSASFSKVNDKNYVDRPISIFIATAFLTGLAILSALLTFAGLLGQIRIIPLLIMLLPGLLAIVNRYSLFSLFLCRFKSALKQVFSLPKKWLVVVIALCLLIIGCGLGAWMLPPIGDAAAFYMLYAKLIAASGTLEPMESMYNFSTIGLPIELHYASLILLSDVNAAKLFMLPVALSVCVFLNGIVRLCGGGKIALILSSCLLFSSYTFYYYSFDGKVDLVAAAFGLAAVYLLLQAYQNQLSYKLLALSGWFVGLATMAKFSYIPVLVSSMMFLILFLVSSKHMRQNNPSSVFRVISIDIFKMCCLFAILGVIAWIPQLIKNWMLFDAPLAPFFGLTDKNWLNQEWFNQEVTRRILLTYPFALVYGRYPMQGGGLSFLFIAFLPFLFWLNTKSCNRTLLFAVTFSGLVSLAVWMLIRPSVIAPRYILATLLLFVPVLAIAVEHALKKINNSKLVEHTVVAATLLAILISFWHLLPVPSALLSKIRGNDQVCSLAPAECRILQHLNSISLPGERIFIASYYPYWLKASLLKCRETGKEKDSFLRAKDPIEWLKVNGFNYIFIDATVDNKSAEYFDKNIEEVILLDKQDKKLYLYEIKNPLILDNQCVPNKSGS
jgi:hypothetical protein